MTVDDVKTWLKGYSESEKRLNLLYERLDALQSKMYSVSTSHPDGMPRGSSASADKIGTTLAAKETLQNRILDLTDALNDYRDEIETAVASLSAERETIVSMRYIDGTPWTEIARAIYGDYTGYESRPDSFLRRTYREHGRALQRLAESIPEQGAKTPCGNHERRDTA